MEGLASLLTELDHVTECNTRHTCTSVKSTAKYIYPYLLLEIILRLNSLDLISLNHYSIRFINVLGIYQSHLFESQSFNALGGKMQDGNGN